MRRKTGSRHYIGQEFPKQRKLTVNYTRLIRKIYSRDIRLTPRQQQLAIMALPGITSDQLELIIKSTGPKLAQSIRKLISSYRATTRSKKQKNKKRYR